jgi:hypothetical protein
MIINAKGDTLDSDDIQYLLQYPSEPKTVVNILGDKINGYLKGLSRFSMINLLEGSNKPNEVVNILLDNIELIPITSKTIRVLFEYSNTPKNIMDVLGDSDEWVEYISDLKSWEVYNLLFFSSEPEQIMLILKTSYDKLGMDNKEAEVFNSLDSQGIRNLLNKSQNPEAIKRLFDKYGIDYSKNESVKSLLRKKMIYL